MDHLNTIRSEGDVFYAAALVADSELGVPCCPDWNIADLVWHLSEVHWFWATIIDQRITDRSAVDGLDRLDRPASYGDLVALGRRNLDRLVSMLASNDDATPVWTWAPDQDVGFIRRHQVQEAAVHRWDMQSAATVAPPDPIDPEAASDSIDEFLAVQLPLAVSDDKPLPGSVHLHCTDVEGEWFIHPEGRVEPIHAKGDVAIRGTASDLLLVLYARVMLDDLEVIGDSVVARKLVENLDLE